MTFNGSRPDVGIAASATSNVSVLTDNIFRSLLRLESIAPPLFPM
ncbi:MAG: hypothetical protein AAGL66_14105 [Pseudomonadota bacterium]